MCTYMYLTGHHSGFLDVEPLSTFLPDKSTHRLHSNEWGSRFFFMLCCCLSEHDLMKPNWWPLNHSVVQLYTVAADLFIILVKFAISQVARKSQIARTYFLFSSFWYQSSPSAIIKQQRIRSEHVKDPQLFRTEIQNVMVSFRHVAVL